MGTIAGILALLLGSGTAGGYAGYLLGPPDPAELSEEERRWHLKRSLVLGIAASFMVPLFLTVVGAASGVEENLIDHLSGASSKVGGWLVLLGFCLAASISGQRFITAISRKLFEDLLKRTNAMKEDIADLEEDLGEVAAGQAPAAGKISDVSKTVLNQIYRSSINRPTKDDIAKLTPDLPAENLNEALEELEREGLVRSKDDDGKQRWRVRSAGRALVALGKV